MENYKTPNKILSSHAASIQQFYKKSPATFKFLSHFKTQLCNSQKNSKVSQSSLGTQTPDKRNGEFACTPGKSSSLSSTAKSFNLFPIANTPPSGSQRKKITNPFEAALAERLHLPLICSPSLFHRPATPQYSSSTHFEWTIEEVSSMGPANVEPHETQFHDVFDPETEAKTQAAISSFFKEQQIVPSPVDRPLRKQRVVLTSEIENSPNPGRSIKRIRDGTAQTILTLPPVLPLEIEQALKPYFNFIQNQQQSPSINCDKSNFSAEYHEARDASLRRKLFAVPNLANDDTLDDVYDENEIFQSSAFNSPPPKSPDIIEDTGDISDKEHSANAFDKNSFGSLSPISKLSSDSPRLSSEKQYLNNQRHKNISPTKRASHQNITFQQSKVNSTSLQQDNLSSNANTSFINITTSHLYRSTPDNSMQVKNLSTENISEHNMSIDSSFKHKISRQLVNNSKPNDSKINEISKCVMVAEVDIFNQNEYDEDDMQVSQLSEKSANSSRSSNSDTPRRSKKAVNRKNLSRSFSSYVSDDEDELCVDNSKKNEKCTNSQMKNDTLSPEKIKFCNDNANVHLQPPEKCLFHRTDSGFNEMTATQDDVKFTKNLKNDEIIVNNMLNDVDISMISCSTPSRKIID